MALKSFLHNILKALKIRNLFHERDLGKTILLTFQSKKPYCTHGKPVISNYLASNTQGTTITARRISQAEAEQTELDQADPGEQLGVLPPRPQRGSVALPFPPGSCLLGTSLEGAHFLIYRLS